MNHSGTKYHYCVVLLFYYGSIQNYFRWRSKNIWSNWKYCD